MLIDPGGEMVTPVFVFAVFIDTFLRYYNLERSHQGYRLKGRTPAMALRDALQLETLPSIIPEPEETAETEAEKLVA